MAAGRQGRGGELSHKGQRYVASAWVRRREMEMEGRGSRPSLGVFMCNGERSPRLTSPPALPPLRQALLQGRSGPCLPPRVLESQIWDLYHNPSLGAQPKANNKRTSAILTVCFCRVHMARSRAKF